jgi:hypothetical protein
LLQQRTSESWRKIRSREAEIRKIFVAPKGDVPTIYRFARKKQKSRRSNSRIICALELFLVGKPSLKHRIGLPQLENAFSASILTNLQDMNAFSESLWQGVHPIEKLSSS